MPRATNSVASRARRKKVLKSVKGFWGGKGKLFRTAKEALDRSMQYSFIGRKQKKRNFRRLWIIRINAAARMNGVSYNGLISGLKKNSININRKMLAEMAVHDKAGFTEIVKSISPAIAKKA